ncbi:hypothetical protein E4U34_007043 [Claviceps purpurea]|nr:hypothetical protein E4U12_007297 [Claviceps purpurea]KAG6128411.1 hypothetical protein E4U38_005708 [Claviceps purpurea]KAG6129644.1 hypothetical protein E4U28_007730 [Claviceps purpurea]KAG6167938.1 hypothetical protein E4U11_006348 [Claviceps purpurea]KAG6178147.1 hypothetical protein E4U36_006684 [Claviceps purpurea]
MKLFATLPLALFAGEAFAVCGTGTFSGSTDTWRDNKILDQCVLNADNVYYCGSSGTTIVHKQSQLMLRAGNVDSTIIVTCDNLQGFFYHCSAYDSQRFVEPGCKGPIARIQSVKEMIKHG